MVELKPLLFQKLTERDLKEIPDNVLEGLEIHPVTWIDDVLKLALKHPVESFSVETEKNQ